MKTFNTYHEKRMANWYLAWSCLTSYEKMLLGIEFHFPTPKDRSFFFSITIFTKTLFFIEIAKLSRLKFGG